MERGRTLGIGGRREREKPPRILRAPGEEPGLGGERANLDGGGDAERFQERSGFLGIADRDRACAGGTHGGRCGPRRGVEGREVDLVEEIGGAFGRVGHEARERGERSVRRVARVRDAREGEGARDGGPGHPLVGRGPGHEDRADSPLLAGCPREACGVSDRFAGEHLALRGGERE